MCRLGIFAIMLAALIAQSASAQTSESNRRLREALEQYPEADTNGDGVLTLEEGRALQRRLQNGQNTNGNQRVPQQGQGLRQANTMGGGPAPIPAGGRVRLFILAGQSNMTGQGRGNELQPPYDAPHDRIRVWANNRWELFVPQRNFGPGVALAHQLAEAWPEDTICIIKVAIGGTGILAFSPAWSFEQADRTGDGKKGDLYTDIIDAVTAARGESEFEVSGFVWKQGGKDARQVELAAEYFDNLRMMITALRDVLDSPDLPVYIATYMSDVDIEENEPQLTRQRPGMVDVLRAQNRAAREIPHTTAIHHGALPTHADGIHFNTEGQLTLGGMMADVVLENERMD